MSKVDKQVSKNQPTVLTKELFPNILASCEELKTGGYFKESIWTLKNSTCEVKRLSSKTEIFEKCFYKKPYLEEKQNFTIAVAGDSTMRQFFHVTTTYFNQNLPFAFTDVVWDNWGKIADPHNFLVNLKNGKVMRGFQNFSIGSLNKIIDYESELKITSETGPGPVWTGPDRSGPVQKRSENYQKPVRTA